MKHFMLAIMRFWIQSFVTLYLKVQIKKALKYCGVPVDIKGKKHGQVTIVD